jgi:hypothetical protein
MKVGNAACARTPKRDRSGKEKSTCAIPNPADIEVPRLNQANWLGGVTEFFEKA